MLFRSGRFGRVTVVRIAMIPEPLGGAIRRSIEVESQILGQVSPKPFSPVKTGEKSNFDVLRMVREEFSGAVDLTTVCIFDAFIYVVRVVC